MTQKYPFAPWMVEYLPYKSQVCDEIPAYRISVVDENGKPLCETCTDLPGDVQKAAADLIAAAPELLEALTYFFNIMTDCRSSARKGYVNMAFTKARKAIIKANGGTL